MSAHHFWIYIKYGKCTMPSTYPVQSFYASHVHKLLFNFPPIEQNISATFLHGNSKRKT